MSAGGELPASQRAIQAWWLEHVTPAVRASQPTEAQLAEWVALTSRFPKRTRVIVTPALGAAWRGVVQDWTEPGTGRLMAVVRPDEGRGEREPLHVAPRFLTVLPLGVQLAAQPL